jgi:hypothetical protein
MTVKFTGRQWLWVMRVDECRVGGGRRCESGNEVPGLEAVNFLKQSSDPSGYLCQNPSIYSTHY